MKNWKNILLIIITGLLSLLTLNLSAQKETNWWYFGNGAGLNFNIMTAGVPQTLSNGSINTTEGCATISDANGGLLFYTDGIKVWDRNHAQMTNGFGLLGNPSSTQSGVIIPFPGNKNKYYIFSAAAIGISNNGIKYTVVDMTLRSGLGDVVSTTKNTNVFSPSCERITATARTGGGYWVIGQEGISNKYHAYAITSAGVATTAVTSTLGPTPSNLNGIGYMKASPKGNKVGVCYYGSGGQAFIMDFNPSTGALSNVKTDMGTGSFYGLEFSGDGSKLYIATYSSTSIYQFNANATTQAAFRTSRTTITATGTGVTGIKAMQIGPDLKIYIASTTTQLAVIQSPNTQGQSCSLVAAGPTIPTGATVTLGLPTFIQTFFNPTTFSVKDACDSSWVKISVKDTAAVDSVLYIYGDTASSTNSSWNKLDSHIFSGPGKYKLTAYAFYTDPKSKVVRDTLTDTITVLQIPRVVLPNDTTICSSDSIFGLITNPQWASPFKRLWQDSTTTDWYHIDSTGKYYLSATNRCGTGSDTIIVDSLFKRSLDLGNDTVICLGDSLLFDISDTSATYLWNDGYKKANRTIKTTGAYWGESKNFCGTIRDSINIEVLAPPTIDIGKDRKICKSKSEYAIFGETAANKHSYYTWSNGLKGPNTYRILSYNSGTFWVEEKNKCGVAYDTLIVIAETTIPRLFGLDSVVCKGDTVMLKPLHTQLSTYLWSTSSTDSVIPVYDAGSYWLEGKNACGTKRDTIDFILREVPVISLPNDTIICFGDRATLEVKTPNATYLWNTGSVISRIFASTTGLYWVQASNVCGMDRDSVKIEVDKIPVVSLPADTLLCNQDNFFIEATSASARTYLWNTGNLTNKQNIRKGGKYTVKGINKCGEGTAEIMIEHELTPNPKLSNDTTICQGDRIELRTHVDPEILAYSHVKWNNKYDTKELYVERAGWYTAEVSNRCGTGTSRMELKVQGLPRIKTTKDTIVCDNVLEYDNTSTGYTFLWQDGSTTPRYRINSPGEYSVEMWDELGCYSSARFKVRQCPSEMWAPNAFSPNYDELNESFRVYKDGIKDFEIEIYDRWNKLVFSSTNINEGWEGTVDNDDNRPCAQGMYIWKVKFKEIENNQQQIIMGEVNLVR